MVGATILAGLILGTYFALLAGKVPSRVAAFESLGGILLVVSLALLGASLPICR